jgi:hypothetical protein
MLVVPVLFLALGGGVASLELPPAAAVYVARGERTGGWRQSRRHFEPERANPSTDRFSLPPARAGPGERSGHLVREQGSK